ncbi:hypothetical protein AOLI_G00321150 [Acnodon oligacanthus]
MNILENLHHVPTQIKHDITNEPLPFKGVLERLERRTLEVRQSGEAPRAHSGAEAHRGGTLTPTESWGTHTASRVPRVLLSWHGADGTGPQL